MSIITIDLGTTNTKVTRFSRNLEVIATESSPIAYMKEGDFGLSNVAAVVTDLLDLPADEHWNESIINKK